MFLFINILLKKLSKPLKTSQANWYVWLNQNLTSYKQADLDNLRVQNITLSASKIFTYLLEHSLPKSDKSKVKSIYITD